MQATCTAGNLPNLCTFLCMPDTCWKRERLSLREQNLPCSGKTGRARRLLSPDQIPRLPAIGKQCPASSGLLCFLQEKQRLSCMNTTYTSVLTQSLLTPIRPVKSRPAPLRQRRSWSPCRQRSSARTPTPSRTCAAAQDPTSMLKPCCMLVCTASLMLRSVSVDLNHTCLMYA